MLVSHAVFKTSFVLQLIGNQHQVLKLRLRIKIFCRLWSLNYNKSNNYFLGNSILNTVLIVQILVILAVEIDDIPITIKVYNFFSSSKVYIALCKNPLWVVLLRLCLNCKASTTKGKEEEATTSNKNGLEFICNRKKMEKWHLISHISSL